MSAQILASSSRKNNQWRISGKKQCASCKLVKRIEDFCSIKRKSGVISPYSYCRECDSIKAKIKNPRKTTVRFESDTHLECRCCKNNLPKSDFYADSGMVCGYSIYCKRCHAAKVAASRVKSNGEWNRRRWEKIKSSPEAHFKHRCVDLVRKSLASKIEYKRRGSVTSGFWEAVGYSPKELEDHIERQFLPGMSWDNMREWHVDHIIPVSRFRFSSMECEEFKQCWALSNLRPLWARENCAKRDSVIFLL